MSDEGYDTLGFYSLALLYLFLGLGCLISPSVMNRIGVKNSLIFGSVCDLLWMTFQIFPAYKMEYPDSTSFFLSDGFIIFINLFGSILDGFGDAVAWVAQGKYISDCATNRTKGFYFAYFWTYYMFS
jgi:MFS family permease